MDDEDAWWDTETGCLIFVRGAWRPHRCGYRPVVTITPLAIYL